MEDSLAEREKLGKREIANLIYLDSVLQIPNSRSLAESGCESQ
jgi:hypothetical protein